MTLQSQDQLVFYKKGKVQELLLLSFNSFSLPQMGSGGGGGGGAWVLACAQDQFSLIEGFRTNLLTETSFPMPAYKNLSPCCLWQYCSIGKATSGVKFTLGCWSGSLTITYQEHPSPLICLVYTSSFFRPQQECLFVQPSWSAQAEGSPLLPCPRCTVDSPLFLPMLHCIYIICFYHCTFVVLWTSGRMGLCHFSLFPLCQDQWLVQSRKITQWYFWKNDYYNRWVICDGLRNAFSSAREPIYKETFGI